MQETAKKRIDNVSSPAEIPNGTEPAGIPVERSPQPNVLIRILREPLLHFLVLGALLFGLYFWVNGTGLSAGTPRQQINIAAGDVALLKSTWQQQWGHPPTPKELERLVDQHIRDEILYQEALALGLDNQDTIVRRRLVQKMQFLVEDVLPLPEPSDDTLQTYLDAHADRYAIPGRFSFDQIYFSRELRRDRTEADALTLLNQLRTDPSLAVSQPQGDRSMLPAIYTLASTQTLNNTFGGTLAQEMAAITEPGWQGPFHSAYGSHLANVTQIEPGHPAALAEVRKNVRLDWLRDQRQQQDEQFYQQLRDRYTITIAPDALPPATQEDEA